MPDKSFIGRFSSSVRRRRRVASVFLYGSINFLPRLTSGLLAIFYARVFAAAEYGNYGVFAAVIYLLIMAMDFGISSAVLRNFYAARNQSREYLASIVLSARVLTLAVLPLFAVLLYVSWGALGVRFTQVWIFGSALLVIAYLGRAMDMQATVCRALEQPTYFAAGQAAQALVSTLSGIGLVFLLRLGVGGALLAMIIGQSASVITYEILLRKTLRCTDARFDWPAIRECLSFGLPLVPDRIAIWARLLAMRPILAQLVSLSAAGLFSLASAVAVLPNLVTSAIDLALTPIYFRQREAGDPVTFHSKNMDFGAIYAASMLPIWTVAVLFCPEFIRTLAAPRFAGAIPVTAILLCASFVRFQIPFLLRQIQFLKRTGLQPAITVPWSLAAVILTAVVCRQYGITSAAWITFAADFGILISTGWVVQRHERIGYPMLTGILFSIFLAALAEWVAITGTAQESWAVIFAKATLTGLVTAASLSIWIWPKRGLILELASR